jgi:hypothetical protein
VINYYAEPQPFSIWDYPDVTWWLIGLVVIGLIVSKATKERN